MAMATDEWPKSALGKLCAEITALRDQMELVKKHINQRPEYVIALKDGGSGDSADYYRWTGNAEGRRQLAEDLRWTVPHNPGDRTRPKPAEEKGNPSEFPNSSPSVVHIHHHDIEAHAASFNEGFEEAVRQLAEPAQATINLTLKVPAPAEPAEEETKAEQLQEELEDLTVAYEAAATVRDEAVSLSYWLAKQLGEHVDDACDRGETLTDTVQRLIEHVRLNRGKTKTTSSPVEEETKAETETEWGVEFPGGICNVSFDPAEAEEMVQWIRDGQLVSREVTTGPWVNVPASSPVVPAPTEASVIGDAAVALRAALAVVDPHEAGPWEHAWLSVRDLEDCASRAEVLAESEWQTWQEVPRGQTVRAANGERFRKNSVGAIHLLTNGDGDCCQMDRSIAETLPAPFVATEEQDR